MHYKLLAYTLYGDDEKGHTVLFPYKRETETEEAVRTFVTEYLNDSKIDYKTLHIETLRRYDSEQEWILDVHQKEAFRRLHQLYQYGDELLDKYDLRAAGSEELPY